MEFYNYKNESLIPRKQGVYSFFIDCISLEKLGLLKDIDSEYSTEQLSNAKLVLLEKLNKISALYSFSNIEGVLHEVDKQTPGLGFILTGSDISTPQLLDFVLKIKPESIPSFIELFQSTVLFQRPIYCGITKKQTLEMRYRQHRLNFYSDESKNTFGYRLKQLGFEWDDVVFFCKPFKSGHGEHSELNAVEKYLMLTARPALSNK